MIRWTLGKVLMLFAALMLLPIIAGLWYRENVLNFIITAAATAVLAGLMLIKKPQNRDIFAREGFVMVGLAWILMSLIGAIPFVISGDIPRYIDAVFETVSGLTTTGASILTDIEGRTRSGLFWRSFTHWIGGMGVLVFIMAVMPMDTERSMHIMRAEVPGPTVGKLVPRLRDTAKILYIIYTVFTVVETVLLMIGGMSFYDALLHAFGTAGTGGFSTRAAGLAAFDSAFIDGVVSFFLILYGINFNLYYLIIIGRMRDALKSEELHWYFVILIVATAALTIGTAGIYTPLRAVRYSLLTVTCILSTAGFTSVDFTLWPMFTQLIIVVMMFIGGCAGSTGGGLKLSRVLLLIKTSIAEVGHSLHPRRVRAVKLEGKSVDSATIRSVLSFFALYMIVLMVCAVIISFDGKDFTTCFTAALSCISNIGPGLGEVGPMGGYAMFSDLSKIVMSITMLLGRLEIYPILILCSASVWVKNRIK